MEELEFENDVRTLRNGNKEKCKSLAQIFEPY